MKICIGHGTNGEILKDYEEAKSCHYCTKFCGYGLYWFAGKCKVTGEDINFQDYSKMAKECGNFDCKPELLRDENKV